MPHALQQHVIADGKITLYQREDVKVGLWHCRMIVKGHRGYVRRSTGETDLEKAKEVSLQIPGELKQRKSRNLPMDPQNLRRGRRRISQGRPNADAGRPE